MSALAGFWVLILIVRALQAASGAKGTATTRVIRWRWIAAATVIAVWSGFGLLTVLPMCLFALSDKGSWGLIALASTWTTLFAIAGALLFAPWPLLRALSRRGRPRLVCALTHVTFAFFISGETASAATLLAALAIAHRGQMTPAERAWLEKRLRRETRFLGTYATARAFVAALDAREHRDAGRIAEAREASESARILLGTVTYLSKRGVPESVRQLSYEYLALDAARTAQWGGVHVPPKLRPTRTHGMLYDWARERFFDGEPLAPGQKARARLRPHTPLLQALDQRPREATPLKGASDAHACASRAVVALWSGQSVAPRTMMNTLIAMDILTHPEAPDCLIPPEMRADEAKVAALHDEIASTLAEALSRTFVPLHALTQYGPISARVHQKIESGLLAEWTTLHARVQERRKGYERRTGYDEWMEISRMRFLYRRVEYCLGPDAVARLWPEFSHAYGFLGVGLSETYPRMRPLAHAVFACMAKEAERFQDLENVALQAKNMAITAGPG